jgi:hypothetical protein
MDLNKQIESNILALAFVHPLMGIWLAMGLVFANSWATAHQRG